MASKKKSGSVTKKDVFYFEIFEDDSDSFTIYLYEEPPPFDEQEVFKEFYYVHGFEECLAFIDRIKSAEVYVTRKQTVQLA